MAFRRVVISGNEVEKTNVDLSTYFLSSFFTTNYSELEHRVIKSPIKEDTLVVDLNGSGADTVSKKIKNIAGKYKMKAVIKLQKPITSANK